VMFLEALNVSERHSLGFSGCANLAVRRCHLHSNVQKVTQGSVRSTPLLKHAIRGIRQCSLEIQRTRHDCIVLKMVDCHLLNMSARVESPTIQASVRVPMPHPVASTNWQYVGALAGILWFFCGRCQGSPAFFLQDSMYAWDSSLAVFEWKVFFKRTPSSMDSLSFDY
jgi:hypothetical protein